MAKKKDTLKDLNEFMKNQKVENQESEDFMERQPTLLADIDKLKSEVQRLEALPINSLLEEDLIKLIQKIAISAKSSPRHILFNVAEALLEQQQNKDHIDLLLENNIALLKYHQLLIDKLQK